MLHHVYCYGASKGLMLIGDDKKLSSGFLVEFENQLIEAWGKVCDIIYERALEWANKPGGLACIPQERIEKALASTTL